MANQEMDPVTDEEKEEIRCLRAAAHGRNPSATNDQRTRFSQRTRPHGRRGVTEPSGPQLSPSASSVVTDGWVSSKTLRRTSSRVSPSCAPGTA